MADASEQRTPTPTQIWLKGIGWNLATSFLTAVVLSIAWTIWVFATGRTEAHAWGLVLGFIVLPFVMTPFVGFVLSVLILTLKKKIQRLQPYVGATIACLVFHSIALLIAVFSNMVFMVFSRILS